MSLIDLAEGLIDDERARSRVKRPIAVANVARAAGLQPGTVENLIRGRLKYVERVERAINRLAVVSIERKIASLGNQLAIIRATALDPREPDILGAQAALDAARACIERARQ